MAWLTVSALFVNLSNVFLILRQFLRDLTKCWFLRNKH